MGLYSNPPGFFYVPIVAWIVVVVDDLTDSFAFPICTDANLNDAAIRVCIRYPDGSLAFEDRPTFEKGREAEALARAVEIHARERELLSKIRR